MRSLNWVFGVLLICASGCQGLQGPAPLDEDPQGAEAGGAPMLLTALTGEASPEDCPNGGVILSQGIDQNLNARLDEDEISEQVTLCHGRDGAAGVEGTKGPMGASGEGCSAVENEDGSFTIQCPESEPITIRDGADGAAGAEGPAGAHRTTAPPRAPRASPTQATASPLRCGPCCTNAPTGCSRKRCARSAPMWCASTTKQQTT